GTKPCERTPDVGRSAAARHGPLSMRMWNPATSQCPSSLVLRAGGRRLAHGVQASSPLACCHCVAIRSTNDLGTITRDSPTDTVMPTVAGSVDVPWTTKFPLSSSYIPGQLPESHDVARSVSPIAPPLCLS